MQLLELLNITDYEKNTAIVYIALAYYSTEYGTANGVHSL